PPLTGVLAWRLWRSAKTAVLAGLIIALSPYAIQFSATAYTDPLLTFWLVAALVTAVSGQTGWSGFWFGLAFLTKYQAVLFFPLLVGIGWLNNWPFRRWQRWFVGVLVVVVILGGWGYGRSGLASLWQNQINNYGGIRLAWSWELWPRLQAWLTYWSLWVGSGWLLTGLFVVIFWRWQQQHDIKAGWVALFVAGYLCLHWLLGVPVWDRYLLPIVPLIALLVAWAIGTGTGLWHKGVTLLLIGGMVGAAVAARNGRFPIGSSPQADSGAAMVAAHLADAPYGTVLYDHWYSWQWRYHLFDTGVYVSWFPYPEALVKDLTAFFEQGGDRYLVLPADKTAEPVIRTLTNAGFVLVVSFKPDNGNMILYQIARVE
ncbi:MAG: hypothetical protein D6706_05130, partial [Chloroflexi bacterium]